MIRVTFVPGYDGRQLAEATLLTGATSKGSENGIKAQEFERLADYGGAGGLAPPGGGQGSRRTGTAPG